MIVTAEIKRSIEVYGLIALSQQFRGVPDDEIIEELVENITEMLEDQ